ncbi:hypothetical protein ACLQ26_08165 [Micromonospora sp. DT43]|uniref:hypothetical protein n=1 Tax=Micromonospora sp. DT43 TaxID=3393440 RepID=UPI003CFB7A2D
MGRSSGSEPDFADTPSPWTRPAFVVSAVVVGLIVLGGIVVAVRSGDPDDTPPAAGTSAPAPVDGSAPAPTGDLPTAVPTAPPADVTWQLVGQSAVPVSRTAGPSKVDDATAAGFAHTPEGALIAAAQLGKRAGFASGRQRWEPTITGQFIANADREQLLRSLRAQPEQPAEPGELNPLAGFIYQSYTPDTAVIGVVYRSAGSASGRYNVVTYTLVWRDGDWRMVPPPGGSWLSVNRATTDLTGVVQWGAR